MGRVAGSYQSRRSIRGLVRLGPFFAFLVPSLLGSAAGRDLRDPQFMAEAEKGFDQIFNLDYEPAIETFSTLKARFPEHPAPPVYLAVTVWMRELFERQDLDLDKFVAPGYFLKPVERKMPLEERQKFFSFIEQSQKLAQAILERHPGDKDARYFLGTAYGVLGAFSITVDHSKGRAFKYGKQAYKSHSELVEEDPEYYDSYMSVGLYEYIVDNLPWYIKWLAIMIGYRGSEERGFQYLKLAAQKGQYVADDARVLLMVLYVREKQYDRALETALHLHRKYPRSFLLHLNRAQILEKMGKEEQAAEEYRQILRWAEAGKANYRKIDLATFRCTAGRKFMDLRRWDLALGQFERALNSRETPERERALSHLRAGQVLDLQGRRTEAVVHYEQVLKFRNFEDSHQLARNFLQRPYQAGKLMRSDLSSE